jgi:hypothetical protein
MTVLRMISEAETCDCLDIPLSHWRRAGESEWFVGSALIPIPEEFEQFITAMAELDRQRAEGLGVEEFKIVCPKCSLVFAEGVLD